MTGPITIILDNKPVIDRLNEVINRLGDPSPALLAIGETVAEQTRRRFSTSTAPDGSRWKPNAPATILSRLNEISGAFSQRTGRITQKGRNAAMGKKPLIDTGQLQDSIHFQLTPDNKGVDIGTNRFTNSEEDGWEAGAAVHQFGSLDGKIPARPFLGLSSSDETEVLDILDNYLRQPLD